jgi:hypothetical protein
MVKTYYNDAGYTADCIVILIVLLYVELYIRFINREKKAHTWLSILKGSRVPTSRAK